jgi:hypothetical protein
MRTSSVKVPSARLTAHATAITSQNRKKLTV